MCALNRSRRFQCKGKSDRIGSIGLKRIVDQNSEKAKLCYFCRNKFFPNHKQSCPARYVTCRKCSKKSHFAKCCDSKNVANVEVESDETTKENCNFITSDKESKFAVLAVAEARTIVESMKKLEVINAATGKLRCIQITLPCGKTFLKL